MCRFKFSIALILISLITLGLLPQLAFGQCSIRNVAAADSVFGSSLSRDATDLSTTAQSSGNLSAEMISAAMAILKESTNPVSQERISSHGTEQDGDRTQATLVEKRAQRMCGSCVQEIEPHTVAAEEVKKLFQIE